MSPLLFSDGKIFETRKRIFYSACVPEVLTIFTWNISIGPKVPGFCRWLARNRSHFPDLNYNERHQVKIIWRHLKKRKGKKKKKEKNTHFGKSKPFFFFLLPLTCWQLKSPHMLIGLPRTVVCGGDNWFMCSFAYPLMPAAEYSTASRSASRHSPGKSGGLSETAVR